MKYVYVYEALFDVALDALNVTPRYLDDDDDSLCVALTAEQYRLVEEIYESRYM